MVLNPNLHWTSSVIHMQHCTNKINHIDGKLISKIIMPVHIQAFPLVASVGMHTIKLRGCRNADAARRAVKLNNLHSTK